MARKLIGPHYTEPEALKIVIRGEAAAIKRSGWDLTPITLAAALSEHRGTKTVGGLVLNWMTEENLSEREEKRRYTAIKVSISSFKRYYEEV